MRFFGVEYYATARSPSTASSRTSPPPPRAGWRVRSGTWPQSGRSENDTGAYFRWYMEQADEHPLGRVDARQFLVDLRGPAPRAVRARLNRAMVTRGFPEGSYDSTTTGGRPGEWFDLVVHRQQGQTRDAAHY